MNAPEQETEGRKGKRRVAIVFIVLLIAAILILAILQPFLLSRPSNTLTFPVSYATAPDRTLVRWYCNTTSPCSRDTKYDVFRQAHDGSESLMATVGPVTDEAAARNLLDGTDPRWPSLWEDLLTNLYNLSAYGVSDIPSLQEFLRSDRGAFFLSRLADERYPVALMMGIAYLDRTFTSGAQYRYRVVAHVAGDPSGSVTLVAGRPTPLPRATGLTATDVGPESPYAFPRDGNWGNATKNRRLDRNVYLRWNFGGMGEGFPAAPVTGYDVFRIPEGSEECFRLTDIHPIQPTPANGPTPPQPSGDPTIPFYYVDKAPSAGTWTYRVAPRDLLDQTRSCPDDEDQLSDPLVATAYDYVPPPAAYDLVANVPASADRVTLAWEFDPGNGTDFSKFLVYRSRNVTAPVFTDAETCPDETQCWSVVAELTERNWTDFDIAQEVPYWYTVQTVDWDMNRGGATMPAQATVHDIEGPQDAPIVREQVPGVLLVIAPSDPEAVETELRCRFTPDAPEVPVARFEGASQVIDLSSDYRSPLPLEGVLCRALSSDEWGNPGTFSAYTITTVFLASYRPTQPLITGAATQVGGLLGWTSVISWQQFETPGLGWFSIQRVDQKGEVRDFVLPDPSATRFSDNSVHPDVVYDYTVTAHLRASAPWNGASATSDVWSFKVVESGQRPLRLMQWLSASWRDSSATVLLRWEITGNYCPVFDPSYVQFPDISCRWAVFRSVHQDKDYIQITPVFWGFPEFEDTTAGRPYYYVVVMFDPRTGEPVAYTPTIQVSTPQPSPIDWSLVTLRRPLVPPISSCTPVSPDPSLRTLHFGAGFDVVNVTWTSLNPSNLTGVGALRVVPPTGPVEFPIFFTQITVGDSSNNVCTGSVEIDFGNSPFRVGGTAPEFSFKIHWLRANPRLGIPQVGVADITIELPDEVTYVDAGLRMREMPLAGVEISANLSYVFGDDLAAVPGHTCTTPAVAFQQETLPAVVIPMGLLQVSSTSVAPESACMNYVDPSGGWPRPPVPNTELGDSNDGFLRAAYDATGLVTLKRDGINGEFMSSAASRGGPVSWVASYPYGFNVVVAGDISLTIGASHITRGTADSTTVSLTYRSDAKGARLGALSTSAVNLEIEQDGALVGDVDVSREVQWMSDGFRLDAGSWELYLGAVTTSVTPESEIWRPRPSDVVDLSPDLPLPAERDPGLNRRLLTTTLDWSNCGGTPLVIDSVADMYVRHGGVSDRLKGRVTAPIGISVHGYPTALEALDLSFLDSRIYDRDVRASITLSFPVDMTLRLIDISFTGDACVGAGQIPASSPSTTLGFWQLGSAFSNVAFRTDSSLPQPSPWDGSLWDRMLWVIGGIDFPHLNTARIQVELSLRPDGILLDVNLVHTTPIHNFDGFTILLEELRLSQPGEVPSWDIEANAVAAPQGTDWNQRGFIEVTGTLVTPYFGNVVSSDMTSPRIFVLGWDDYVGFDRRPRVYRTWMDTLLVSLEMDFFWLVYAHDDGAHVASFAGYYSFWFPNRDEALFRVSASVVLDGKRTDLFIGLSAGIAPLRAIAERIWPDPGNYADVGDSIRALRNQLGMSNYWDQLVELAWDRYSPSQDYLVTTEVLNDLGGELPSGDGWASDSYFDILGYFGLDLRRMRGDAVWQWTEPAVLESFRLFTELTLTTGGATMLHADRFDFEINRFGDYVLTGHGITGEIFLGDLKMDAILRINVLEPAFAGGLTLYDFDVELIHVASAGAVLGVGANTFYIGAFLNDARFEAGGISVSVGGMVLFGRIDPTDPVLYMFAPLIPLFWDANAEAGSPGRLTGFLISAWAEFSLIDWWCLVEVIVGGEIAFWYWHSSTGDNNFGGRIHGWARITVVCLVSARIDVFLQYWHLNGYSHLRGWIGIAFGFGFCDTGDWWKDNDGDGNSWDDRFWGDDWCWQAGAYGSVEFDGARDEWDSDIEGDCEIFC